MRVVTLSSLCGFYADIAGVAIRHCGACGRGICVSVGRVVVGGC